MQRLTRGLEIVFVIVCVIGLLFAALTVAGGNGPDNSNYPGYPGYPGPVYFPIIHGGIGEGTPMPTPTSTPTPTPTPTPTATPTSAPYP